MPLVLMLGAIVLDLALFTIELDVLGFLMLAKTTVSNLFLSFVWVEILGFSVGTRGVIFLRGILAY